jgi:molybdopterin converting factor small subunit
MRITIELTYDMSKALGVRAFDVDDAPTVADALRITRERFGERGDAFAKLTRVAGVAINGVLISHARGMSTPLADGDRVTFVKAAAGG